MKRVLLAAALVAVQGAYAADVPAAAPAGTDAPSQAAPLDEGKVAYSLGFNMGKRAQQSFKDLKLDMFIAGFRDAYTDKPGMLKDEEIRQVLTDYNQQRMEQERAEAQRLLTEGKAKSAAYLAENAKKPGVKTTASGLQYEVLKEGTGATPRLTDTVEVHYEGKLIDGTVFDSSVARNQTASFRLDQVIKGWSEAVMLMKEGAKYRFVLPPELAYGDQPPPSIPPNSALIFEVELFKVTRNEAPAAATPAPAPAKKPAAKKK